MVNLLKFRQEMLWSVGLLLLGAVGAQAQTPDVTDTTYVRFNTSLGNIDVQLLTKEAPKNVANFMAYVNSGAYANTIFHRAIPNFIIQGGGFSLSSTYLTSGNLNDVTANAPVQGEPGFSNKRGTLALALQSVDVSAGGDSQDTGTTNWFFNDVDNTELDSAGSTTDSQGNPAISGPFTVFGVVANASSLAVMDAITNVQTFDFGSAFDTLPLLNFTMDDYNANETPPPADFVYVNSITNLSQTNFATWQTNNFTGALAGQGAPSATPFHDGVTNLVKYLCDINPTAPITLAEYGRLPIVGSTTVSNVKYMTLTYHQITGAGVTVGVQTSNDLQTWSTPTDQTTSMTGTDSSGYSIMQTIVPATGSVRFIRLNLTQTQ